HQRIACRHLRPAREIETRTHHTNDRVALMVNGNELTDDIRVAAKAPLPQVVADDGNFVFSRLFFIGGKDSSEHRLRSQQRKEVRSSLHAADAFGIALLGKIREPGSKCSDLLERLPLAAPIKKVRRRGRQFVKSKI